VWEGGIVEKLLPPSRSEGGRDTWRDMIFHRWRTEPDTFFVFSLLLDVRNNAKETVMLCFDHYTHGNKKKQANLA
jgi:hypothetical protein